MQRRATARQTGISGHVNQASLKERLTTHDPKIRLMIFGAEVNRGVKSHVDIFEVHILVSYESMLSSYKTPEVRRGAVRK